MTMLEVLVAIAIMTAISTLVFPELQRMRSRILVRSSAQHLVMDLRRSRAGALVSATASAVTIHPDGRAYNVIDVTRDAPNGITFSGSVVRFYPDGTASGGALAVTGYGHRIGIVVDPVLGNVVMGASQ